MLLKTPTRGKGVYTFLELDSHVTYVSCKLAATNFFLWNGNMDGVFTFLHLADTFIQRITVHSSYIFLSVCLVYARTKEVLMLGYRSSHIYLGDILWATIVFHCQ